jgi:3-(3-hydroxy-phenyl)propionate hydroxylase
MPDVVRARVYIHHSRVAATFQVGRVLLAGDAAHLQPPFFGQGMNSGLRDATNLAWKLAAVTRGVAGEQLVATYDVERRPHATEMVRFATRIGAMYRPRNIVTERVRDVVFRGIQLFPGGRDYILQMKYKPMPRYTDGAVAGVDRRDRNDPVGRMFPQPDVAAGGTRTRLDDALGPWFAVLCVDGEPEPEREALDWLRSIGAGVFVVRSQGATAESGSCELVDVDGAIARWRAAHPAADVVILRPDRYVAAACRRSELSARIDELRQRFGTVGH